jgi:hypothetical protein
METKNESEKIFEQYLDANGFQDKWTHEPSIPGKHAKPDYLVHWKGDKCFFEVKELRKKPNDPTRPAHIYPYQSLRSEINEARKQLKQFKEYSCSLVVFNVDDRTAILRPIFVFGAMLGNLGLKMDFDPKKGEAVAGSERNAFLNGGKMTNNKSRQPQNTTISAILVLEEFLDNTEIEKAMRKEEAKQGKQFTGPEMIAIRMELYKDHPIVTVPRVVVIENPFARIPFPKDLFKGPFDEHWRWREDLNGKTERVFVGNKLKKLEDLKGKSEALNPKY